MNGPSFAEEMDETRRKQGNPVPERERNDATDKGRECKDILDYLCWGVGVKEKRRKRKK
jgi:hypothetical protein